MDIISELIEFLFCLGTSWLVIFLGGLIYGLNRKIGVILILAFVALIYGILLMGFYYLYSFNKVLTLSWGPALGGGIAGLTARSIFGIRKSTAETIKKMWGG